MNASALGWLLHGERLSLLGLLRWRRAQLCGVRMVARCPVCSADVPTPIYRRHVNECHFATLCAR